MRTMYFSNLCHKGLYLLEYTVCVYMVYIYIQTDKEEEGHLFSDMIWPCYMLVDKKMLVFSLFLP